MRLPLTFTILVVLTASPLTGWCYFSVSQYVDNGCSGANPDTFTDTFTEAFINPIDISENCFVGFPPVEITEIANSDVQVLRAGVVVGPNHPLPFSASVSTQTTYDSGATASVTENFFLQFNPPGGGDPGAVVFSLLDTATYNISTSAPAGAGRVYLQIASPSYTSLYQRIDKAAPGSGTFDVQTPQVSIRCCQLLVQLTAFASASGNATASLSDPLDVVLTPDEIAAGWTWTFSDPVPEPSEFFMIGIGLLVLSGYRTLGRRSPSNA